MAGPVNKRCLVPGERAHPPTGILELMTFLKEQGLGERQVEAYPRTRRGPLTFGKVNGRRKIGVLVSRCTGISLPFSADLLAYPPDETWGGPCRR